jgi:2-polyprenyl-3-methyl-5-hydroxy-6-metoxy-1,4-benzoquinol methylase
VAFAPINFYDAESTDNVAPRRAIDPREKIAIEISRAAFERRDGRLLDVGCGNGVFLSAVDQAESLTNRGWKLHGIDYSEHQIEESRARPFEFAQCNVEEGLPFPDAFFDVAFAGELLEHLYNPDGFIEECHRVVTPGGYLVITTPNLQAWYNRLLFLAGVQPIFYETSTRSTRIGAGVLRRLKHGSTPVGHVRVFNLPALQDLLRSQGFQPITVRGAIFTVFPKPVQAVDHLFDRVPSLASGLVVLSRRV